MIDNRNNILKRTRIKLGARMDCHGSVMKYTSAMTYIGSDEDSTVITNPYICLKSIHETNILNTILYKYIYSIWKLNKFMQINKHFSHQLYRHDYPIMFKRHGHIVTFAFVREGMVTT